MNSSFEEYSVPCEDVDGRGRIFDALGWQRAMRNYFGASDLMSPCSWSGYNTPSNIAGNQKPQFGTNYGFIAFLLKWHTPSDHEFHIESVQPTMNQALLPNTCYVVEFDLSLADYSSIDWEFGLDLYFSREDFTMPIFSNPGIIPQYSFGRMDTLSKSQWRRMSMEVAFTDTMNYLTIGWFTSPWNYPPESYYSSGYYIDNVVLYPCSAQTYSADAGSDQLACVGDSVTFSTPYRNEEYRYLWLNTSGDTLSTNTDLTVEVSEDTEYYLWQLDFKYDESWDTVRVRMEGCPELELPNVFTPNGDFENDLWLPILRDIDEIDISIFSRWGESVFHYSGAASNFPGWDGGNAPEGTYYVVAKGVGIDGKVIEKKNTLTLFR